MASNDAEHERTRHVLRQITGADEKPVTPPPFKTEETSHWQLYVFFMMVMVMVMLAIAMLIVGSR